MLRKFYKMQGIGNDYIYFDCLEEPLENPAAAAVKLRANRPSLRMEGASFLDG